MNYIENYLKDVMLIKPLGKVTTYLDDQDGLSGEGICINGVDVGIFVAHADYCDWLEKKVTTLN